MNQKSFRNRLLLGAAAFFVATAGAQAASLQDELSYLLTAHPRVKAASNSVSGAQEQIRQAFAAYLPRVDTQLQAGWDQISSPGFRAARNGKAASEWGDTLSLTVTQTLFDGLRREANYDEAKVNKVVQDLALDTTRQTLTYDGARAYIDVLRFARLVELARTNEATVQRQLSLEDERVQRGAGIAIDVLFAKSRLQLAKERRVQFEGQLQEASARYQQLFNKAPTAGSMADPSVPANLLPANLDDARNAAINDNPQVQSSNRQIDMATSRKQAAGADYFPRVDLELRGEYADNYEAVKGYRTELTALVRARWNIFNGFATQAAVAEASYRLAGARDQFDSARRQVTEEVDIAWNELQTANQRVALLENAVSIAAEVFEARRRLRDAGRETAINVLDAENELYTARINLLQATFDSRKASYRVLMATGRLTPAMLGVQLAAN
ncbi:TolC family outer membrane protein [Lacibacterium aquatile]|uniref:TolC family outer membrane protein n=1 Tax=Lacibacterium aquatile TaxID=1168082 RepID=A0ABW5DR05_9PROT